MNITKIENISIRPTEKKIKRAKEFTEDILGTKKTASGLPKEMPIEKKIYIPSERDIFERSKDSIEVALNNIKGR